MESCSRTGENRKYNEIIVCGIYTLFNRYNIDMTTATR